MYKIKLSLVTTLFCCLLLLGILSMSAATFAQQNELESTSAAPSEQTLAEQLQQLKKEVIALNRDLFVLEEDLLFPSSTQLVVYLSMDVGNYFKLDSVEVKLDDESATHYLYTEKQQEALVKGGVQKLHLANLAQGEHVLTAFFLGKGPHERDYKRATSFTFIKSADAKMLELRIVDSSALQQPEFKVIEL
jgi:ribosomal protein L31